MSVMGATGHIHCIRNVLCLVSCLCGIAKQIGKEDDKDQESMQ